MLSTDQFKAYDNGLLDQVQHSGRGAEIGKIGIVVPACADDTENQKCHTQNGQYQKLPGRRHMINRR